MIRDAVHGVIGDARQDLAQVRFRIDSIEFRRADQAGDGGRARLLSDAGIESL
jgi:hypothetical protein